jgi:hypothetical protein
VTKNIYLCINRGRRVRDLLHLGMLDALLAPGSVRCILLTPAYRVRQFTSEFSAETVVHRPLFPFRPSAQLATVDALARRYARNKPLTQLWRLVQDRLWGADPGYGDIFAEFPPDLFITANLLYYDDGQAVYQARRCGFKTLGLMRSWDNILKRLVLRTDLLSVWNPVNKDEAINIEYYRPQNIYLTGVPDFDLYFAPDQLVPRADFIQSWGLDPNKKILVYATVGTLEEETFLLDILLDAIAGNRFAEPVQIICRLHPSTRLEYFWKYRDHPDLRFSFIDKYIPTLGWTMTREDVAQVANMLHHADVIVTPGSTMMIESAIFDTPTVVPVFSTVQPEITQSYYAKIFARHFRRIAELELVPIVRDVDQLIQWVNRCLRDPSLYRQQRAQLVQDYVHFTDGRASQRIAELILQLVGS